MNDDNDGPRVATLEQSYAALRRFGWLRPDADGVERMHTTRPPLSSRPVPQQPAAPAERRPMPLPENVCMPGLPVRLSLGVEIDTTIGRVARPARFVADDKAEGGRRMVHALDPEPEPRPLHGLLTGAARAAGRGAPLLVPVTWEDGSRSEVRLDQIEQAGEAPAPIPSIPPDRAAVLEERIGRLEERIAALELAEAGVKAASSPGGVPFEP